MINVEILKNTPEHNVGDIIEVQEITAKLLCSTGQAKRINNYSNKMLINKADK